MLVACLPVDSSLAWFQNLLVENIWPAGKQRQQAFLAPWGLTALGEAVWFMCRGHGVLWLGSPRGLRRVCALLPRPHDYSADGFNDWAFMTTHSWDEDPSGEWALEIENTSEANNYGLGAVQGWGTRGPAGGSGGRSQC